MPIGPAHRDPRPALLAALLLVFACACPAWADSRTEAEQARLRKLKAAFTFNFIKFVEWPKEAFAKDESPITVVVVNDVRLANTLAATVKDRQVNKRKVLVRHIIIPLRRSYENQEQYEAARKRIWSSLLTAHAVYFSPTVRNDARTFIKENDTRRLLTIGDGSAYVKEPTTLDLKLEEGRLVFYANMEQVKASTLRISSRLLRLARTVQED